MPPDENNQVLLRSRSMLIKAGNRIVLVNTGTGRHAPVALDETSGIRQPRESLPDRLRKAGVSPAKVTDVIETHLHASGCGWITAKNKAGRLAPTFSKARHWIQKREWELAFLPRDFGGKAFRPDLLAPLAQSKRLQLMEGEKEIAEGIRLLPMGCHTGGDQIVTVSDGRQTVAYVSALVPTTLHVTPAVISATDLYPVETFRLKTDILTKACAEKWLLAFQYDPYCVTAHVEKAKSGWACRVVEKQALDYAEPF
jgi:glyoxylase-like metal-dependent hydrolase (beta-lactamase superfamily II)